jgi:poly-gamma-glutamate capsule biosynthesis protein CapA/YwtB (metallophosphatase superfamily)
MPRGHPQTMKIDIVEERLPAALESHQDGAPTMVPVLFSNYIIVKTASSGPKNGELKQDERRITMQENFKIAVTGDAIINRRISICKEKAFLSLINIIRDADVAYTNFETLIHDYDGPEVYPGPDPGWTSMRSPRFVAKELKWAGFNLLSLASNHSLDYCYGGLKSTRKVLQEEEIIYAGTGNDLGEAREPAYLDLPKGRVALISMCSSFVGWERAGEARRDMKGRPGLNPLRFYYKVDAKLLEMVKHLAVKMGWWVTKVGKDWLFNPAGMHNTIYRFVESDEPGISTAADERDVEGNLQSIRNAKNQVDYVLVHLHNHEWDPEVGLHHPAKFVPPFAKACIDAGTDVFIAEGSHSPLRGIEVYKNKAIFYDPGDLFTMSDTVTKLPSDVYLRAGYDPDVRKWDATPTDFYRGRAALPEALFPPGGYGTKPFSASTPSTVASTKVQGSSPYSGSVVGICSFDQNCQLIGIDLYPFTRISKPRSRVGIPLLAEAGKAKEIIEYLNDISAPFGTKIEFRDGHGTVKL